MDKTVFEQVVGMMPEKFREVFEVVDASIRNRATEIRLRAGRPATINCGDRTYFISPEKLIPEQADIRSVLAHMCEYSLYKREDELRNGFVTIRGGHRIGVCSTLLPSGFIDLAAIGSITVRIAREHKGCASKLFGATMMDGLSSVLIAGPPLSGKTTLLRDLTRIIAGKPLYKKVVVIDERGEISSVSGGRPTMDIGVTSDVLDGYSRKAGFDIAVRTLCPDMIVCDELGSDDDCSSIRMAANSGVYVAASAHATSLQDLIGKPSIKACIDTGVFDAVVFVNGAPNIGEIQRIYKVVR